MENCILLKVVEDKVQNSNITMLNEKKEQEIGDYWNYQISADRKNVLVYNNGNWYISNLPTGSLSLKESVSFSDLKINIDLKSRMATNLF